MKLRCWLPAFCLTLGMAIAPATRALEPEQLLGESIAALYSRMNTGGSGERSPALSVSPEDFDFPAPDEIDTLLNARVLAIPLRGANDIKVNSKAAPAIALLAGGNCAGSFVDGKGHILTSWHCVKNRAKTDVILYPRLGQRSSVRTVYQARVLYAEAETDLALLKLINPPDQLPHLALANEDEVKAGADVYAIGHPGGLHWSFVKGMVSREPTRMSWSPDDKTRHEAEIIQAQIPVEKGNSGGPLLSPSGRLIGVNSSLERKSELRFTFAIALPEIRRFLNAASLSTPIKVALPTCVPKSLGKMRNLENTGTLEFFDSRCKGVVDSYRLTFDDPKRSTIIAKSTMDAGVVDTVKIRKTEGETYYMSSGSGKANVVFRR